MVSESERTDAVADLLRSEVERTVPRNLRKPADVSRSERWRGRFGSVAVTGVVAAAVVAVSVIAITGSHGSTSAPAGPSPFATAERPKPGDVLARFDGRDGREQSKPLPANGSAVRIDVTCSGTGTIAVTIPGGPDFSGPCSGTTTTASPTPVQGVTVATVTTTGAAQWTVSIEAITTHGNGVIFPG